MIKILLCCFIGMFVSLTNTVLAQENVLFNDAKFRLGFIYGYGSQFQLDVDYDYRIHLLQVQFYYALVRKKTWALDILAQPQFNISQLKQPNHSSGVSNGFEYGLNIGLLLRKNFIQDFLSLYTMVSTGPHHISDAPSRQINGFILSTNILAGLNVGLYENLYLDLRLGYRHLSNASIEQPNWGVDNTVLGAGVLMNLY